MNKLILFLALSAPLVAQSAWVDSNGKPVPDTESMRSDGNFGVQIVLTPNEEQFRQTWNSTKGTPKLVSTNSVRFASSVSALIILHGCTPNLKGVCDVVSEFVLESPNGAKFPAGGGPVWSSAPMQSGLLQLGQASMTVGFDKNDPVGDYKITSKVKDNVSGKTLTVIRKLSVSK